MDMTCANAIRELMQHLENPGDEHWKAMHWIAGYLSTRSGKGRIVRGPKELRIVQTTQNQKEERVYQERLLQLEVQ